jgi:hypothetical protein
MYRDIDPRSPDFIPHMVKVSKEEIMAAVADLGAVAVEGPSACIRIPLPHTRRDDGTIDVIDVADYDVTGHGRPIYFGRVYGDGSLDGFANITGVFGRFPGWMVILAARAVYDYVSRVGEQGLPADVEGDIIYALGLGSR